MNAKKEGMVKPTSEEKEERLPIEVRANMLSRETSVYFNLALFEQVQRVAIMFSKSTMIPEHFRGNIGNCMIALNYAYRLKADEFMVFQCLYEVHGRPGIEGKLVEAIINASNKYSEPLQYEWLDPEDKIVARHIVLNHKEFKAFGCQTFSVDAKSGQRVDGPKITWELIKAKGWYDRKGPDGTLESNNWRTMPEMMFYYRAASWFSNKNCPELKLGMHTVEELEDIVELRPRENGAYAISDSVAALNEKIKQPASTDEQKSDIYKAQEIKLESEEKPESGPDPDEENKKPEYSPFVQQFIKLRKGDGVKTGLGPAMLKNKAAIQGSSPEDQEIIKKKFYTLYGAEVSYPLDPLGEKEPETEEKTEDKPDASPTEEEDKILELVKGAELTDFMGEPAIVINCSERDDKPTTKWCNGSCTVRQGCDSWKKYDAWKLG